MIESELVAMDLATIDELTGVHRHPQLPRLQERLALAAGMVKFDPARHSSLVQLIAAAEGQLRLASRG